MAFNFNRQHMVFEKDGSFFFHKEIEVNFTLDLY